MEYSAEIQAGMRAWVNNRAYIDGNGNYHMKGYNFSGPIASWNKAVKRAFDDVSAFAKAAHAWEQEYIT